VIKTIRILPLIIGILCLAELSQAQVKSTPPIDSIIDGIQASHKIELIYQDPKRYQVPEVIFEEISNKDLSRFVSFLVIFQEEISKYPGTFFENSDLFKVVFVKKLFYQNKPAQGVYRTPEGYMFFDIYRDYQNTLTQRHNIHHEIFHMIDASLRRRRQDASVDAYGWKGLNAADFQYQKEGVWHQDRSKVDFYGPPQKGFATPYSLTSIEEDMAEVYACLFVKSQQRLIETWAKKDEILQNKIEKMKEILREFCPQIDAKFWYNLF